MQPIESTLVILRRVRHRRRRGRDYGAFPIRLAAAPLLPAAEPRARPRSAPRSGRGGLTFAGTPRWNSTPAPGETFLLRLIVIYNYTLRLRRVGGWETRFSRTTVGPPSAVAPRIAPHRRALLFPPPRRTSRLNRCQKKKKKKRRKKKIDPSLHNFRHHTHTSERGAKRIDGLWLPRSGGASAPHRVGLLRARRLPGPPPPLACPPVLGRSAVIFPPLCLPGRLVWKALLD